MLDSCNSYWYVLSISQFQLLWFNVQWQTEMLPNKKISIWFNFKDKLQWWKYLTYLPYSCIQIYIHLLPLCIFPWIRYIYADKKYIIDVEIFLNRQYKWRKSIDQRQQEKKPQTFTYFFLFNFHHDFRSFPENISP